MKDYYSKEELCEVLEISYSTLRNMMSHEAVEELFLKLDQRKAVLHKDKVEDFIKMVNQKFPHYRLEISEEKYWGLCPESIEP